MIRVAHDTEYTSSNAGADANSVGDRRSPFASTVLPPATQLGAYLSVGVLVGILVKGAISGLLRIAARVWKDYFVAPESRHAAGR